MFYLADKLDEMMDTSALHQVENCYKNTSRHLENAWKFLSKYNGISKI